MTTTKNIADLDAAIMKGAEEIVTYWQTLPYCVGDPARPLFDAVLAKRSALHNVFADPQAGDVFTHTKQHEQRTVVLVREKSVIIARADGSEYSMTRSEFARMGDREQYVGKVETPKAPATVNDEGAGEKLAEAVDALVRLSRGPKTCGYVSDVAWLRDLQNTAAEVERLEKAAGGVQ